MAIINIPVGSFSSIYIGDYGSSSVMTPITSIRTVGCSIKEELPTAYFTCLDNAIQSGNHIIKVSLTFYGLDDLLVRLAHGLTISETVSNPIGSNQYQLLLLSGDPLTKTSFYFPKIRTEKVMEFAYNKGSATALQLSFTAENRNVNTVLMYKDTQASLKTTMSSISPY